MPITEFDELFANVRRSPFQDDPNRIPQEATAGPGNVAPIGWLQDGAVTADVIRAGSVETDKLAAGAVTAAKIEAGTITSNEIAANTITAANIASNAVTADEIAANTITAAEIAANTLTANEIAASAITASEIAADAVTTTKILAANVTSSRIELTLSGKNYGANSGSAGSPGLFFDAESNMGIYRTGAGTMGLSVGGGIQEHWTTLATVVYNILSPDTDNLHDLGSSSQRWATVYRVAESAVSDEREKKDIADAALGLEFVRSLKPRTFRWRRTPDTQAREQAAAEFDADAMAAEAQPHEERIQKARRLLLTLPADHRYVERLERVVIESRAAIEEIVARHTAAGAAAREKVREGRRLHYGLIAQEVKQALDDAGVDSMDAGFWQEDPDGRQALSYSELTIPLLRAVQELAAANDDLRARVERLEELAQEKHGRSGR